MLEGLPIMLALCFMLWHVYYAQNYAGIIDAGVVTNNKICINTVGVVHSVDIKFGNLAANTD